jgi:membrane protein
MSRVPLRSLRASAAARLEAGPAWLAAGARLAGDVARGARADRIGGSAAEIAFFAVLSVFPALLVLAAALGSLEVLVGHDLASRAEAVVVEFLQRVLTSDAGGAIDVVRQLFGQRRQGLVTAASLFALWGVTRSFATVIRALDLAYAVRESRKPVGRWLTALGLALGSLVLTVVVLAMVVVGPLLGLGRSLADRLGIQGWLVGGWEWVRWPFAFALLVAWATTLYHLAPARRTRWRHDLPGALVAAVGWLAVSLGLGGYVSVVAAANPILGVLGGGLILLVWLYLLGLALLLGGELNAVLDHRRVVGAG